MDIEGSLPPPATDQQASQLRPRLEADYLVTRHTSVLALDQPYNPVESFSQVHHSVMPGLYICPSKRCAHISQSLNSRPVLPNHKLSAPRACACKTGPSVL